MPLLELTLTFSVVLDVAPRMLLSMVRTVSYEVLFDTFGLY